MPDSKLARWFGRRPDTVKAMRLRLGIPGLNRVQKWNKSHDALLGTASDAEVARQRSRTQMAVTVRRRKLGLPKYDNRMHSYTAKENRLLGTMPDEELAWRLGRTPGAIQVRRVAFGIISFERKSGSRVGIPRGRRWTGKELALLGNLPDIEISLRLGRSVMAIRVQRHKLGLKDPSTRKPWTRADVKLLGSAPDADIARRIGRSAGAVKRRRVSLGIAARSRTSERGRNRVFSLSSPPSACPEAATNQG